MTDMTPYKTDRSGYEQLKKAIEENDSELSKENPKKDFSSEIDETLRALEDALKKTEE